MSRDPFTVFVVRELVKIAEASGSAVIAPAGFELA
jgi:hypothetical protein